MKEDIKKQISFIFNKFRWKTFFSFALGAALAIAALGINVQKRTIYRVYVNDTAVGYIKSIEEYEKVREAITLTDGTEPLQHIKVAVCNEYWRKTSDGVKEEKQEMASRGEQTDNEEALDSSEETVEAMAIANSQEAESTEQGYVTSAWIEDYTRKVLDLRVYAVGLYSGSEQIAILANQQDADTVMEEVKKYYYPQSGNYTIISCNIKESIYTDSVMAYRDEIMDTYDTVQKIVDGKGVKKVYEVQKGDTLWDIALRNGISLEELQRANEGMDINKIRIGDKINLSVIEPYVTVTVVADVTSKEVIAFETKKVTDKTLKAGTSVVKQEGQNGMAEVQAHVTLINGNVVTEDVLNRTVIAEPVTRVVNMGANYVASGTYLRPTGGVISSRYGNRHGEFHTGVDFASTRGTKIKASNTGKIVSAGWKGNYGLCVIIDHGNGVQTLYGHCSKLYVSTGDYVSKGQAIAAVGSTGRSTGPHVHFEVRINGKYVNPFKYIN